MNKGEYEKIVDIITTIVIAGFFGDCVFTGDWYNKTNSIASYRKPRRHFIGASRGFLKFIHMYDFASAVVGFIYAVSVMGIWSLEPDLSVY